MQKTGCCFVKCVITNNNPTGVIGSMRQTLQIIVYGLVALLLVSCASMKAQSVESKRFFWPQAPAEPKIEWIGTYYSNLDLKLDKNSLMSKIIGEESATPINLPLGITSDGKGRVYVVDTRNAYVLNFDFNDHDTHILGGDLLATIMRRPFSVTIDADANVYVGDTITRKIYVVNPQNKVIKIFDVSKLVTSIGYMAIDKLNGRLILPDPEGDRVVVTDMGGKLIMSFGAKGAGNGEFNRPNAAAVEKDGTIVVADAFNARVQRFTKEGVFINKFGRRGDSPGDFAFSKGVAIDSDGNIYITDGRLHRVNIYTKDGQGLMTLGEPWAVTTNQKFEVGGFLVPQGIYIDENDRIYIADQQNNRFHIYQYLNKAYLEKHPVPLNAVKQNSEKGIKP